MKSGKNPIYWANGKISDQIYAGILSRKGFKPYLRNPEKNKRDLFYVRKRNYSPKR
jgi:hypothetical protein